MRKGKDYNSNYKETNAPTWREKEKGNGINRAQLAPLELSINMTCWSEAFMDNHHACV